MGCLIDNQSESRSYEKRRMMMMDKREMIVGVLWILLAAGGMQAADAAGAKDGFVPMFDGKTLAGWKTTGNWIVEKDGVISLHPRPGERGWQRYDAYLTTARKYKDFILDLEFKIKKKGNSGVFLRVGASRTPATMIAAE